MERHEGSSIRLDLHKRNWDELAELDPMWAILSDASHKRSGWDIDEFFGTGDQEVSAVMDRVRQLKFQLMPCNMLDFGCGLGRVTRAFASRFQTCFGVDISQRMIETAQQLNSGHANCHFSVNDGDNLHMFQDGSFDLIYTNLVLQHISERETIKSLIG